jgi:hypothetical protein
MFHITSLQFGPGVNKFSFSYAVKILREFFGCRDPEYFLWETYFFWISRILIFIGLLIETGNHPEFAGVPVRNNHGGTWGTLRVIFGNFFLYNFLLVTFQKIGVEVSHVLWVQEEEGGYSQ